MSKASWKESLKRCVHAAVKDDLVQVVVSPDVDGVVSFFLLQAYLSTHSIRTELVGEYDSTRLVLYGDKPQHSADRRSQILQNALFLDLDVRFAKHAIGQHFLGKVELPVETYFNPNVHFEIPEACYTSKYPFGTAQLLMWALFGKEEEAFPILKHPYSVAQSLFVHADSTYSNCKSYKANATAWAKRLFGSVEEAPNTLRRLLSEKYFEGLKVHLHMLRELKKHVYGNRKSGETWAACSGHQTCKGTSSVFALLRLCATYFRTPEVPFQLPAATHVAWEGELRKVQRHIIKNMQEFLLQHNIQSHAVINMRNVSCTFPTESSLI